MRTAIRLLNNWKNLKTESNTDLLEVVQAIEKEMRQLEVVQTKLRSLRLLQWKNNANMFAGDSENPLTPLLMELIMSGRRALGPDAPLETKSSTNVEAAPQEVIDAFRKYREGPSMVRWINTSGAGGAYVQDNVLASKSVGHGLFGGSTVIVYVAESCIRGGKWYWEAEVQPGMNMGYSNEVITLGWCTRSFLLNVNLGQDVQGASVGYNNSQSVVYYRAQTPNSAFGMAGNQGGVFGIYIDYDVGEFRVTHNGSPITTLNNVKFTEAIYPAVSICAQNASVKTNLQGPFKHWSPADGSMPVAHSGVPDSTSFSRYQHAADVTHLVYARAPLPQEVLKLALERQVSLEPADFRYEMVKHDSAVPAPTKVLGNRDLNWMVQLSRSLHVCVGVANTVEIVPMEVSVSFAGSLSSNSTGFIFCSNTLPEFDSFKWCEGWKEAQFNQFLANKLAANEPWKAHYPVGFFTVSSHTKSIMTARVCFARQCKYVSVVLQGGPKPMIKRISVSAVHSTHCLAPLIGSDKLEKEVASMRAQLLEAASSAEPQWTLPMDEALVALVQKVANRLGLSPNSLDAGTLNLSPDLLARFKLLQGVSLPALRARFAVIKYLNRLVTPLLDFVDLRSVESVRSDEPTDEKKGGDQTLSQVVVRLKSLYFISTKKSVVDALLESDTGHAMEANSPFFAGNSTRVRVSINRITSARRLENRSKDPDGLKSQFGQLYTQTIMTNPSSYKLKKDEQAYSVNFVGEGSIDAGGPYRDLLSGVCSELMSDALPLFIPAPNRKNDVGINRDKFLINPSACSSLQLSMYEFVGVLMGLALRTGFALNLDLPSLIWKQLLGDEPDESDMEGADKLFVQAIGEMKRMSREEYHMLGLAEQYHFTTQLSNGKEVEVKKGGKTLPVRYEDRNEYIRLSIATRIRESERQVSAIRKGLNSVVRASHLALLSWYDLELAVCGDPDINVDVLRRHTSYNGVDAGSELVKNFWTAMESFSSEERQLFLRFVWGRSRLPISESDWATQFTINNFSKGDEHLPVSHTCFFSIDLPNYSSYEVLRERLLYAINNCQAIDVDFNPQSSSLNAWVETMD